MGSECNSSRRHYDLSMSRRTRKSTVSSSLDCHHNGQISGFMADGIPEEKGVVDRSHTSLEELIKAEEKTRTNSLRHLMEQEKDFCLGVQEEQSISAVASKSNGMALMEKDFCLGKHEVKEQSFSIVPAKSSGMVGHYRKILKRLIKVKGDSNLFHPHTIEKRATIRPL